MTEKGLAVELLGEILRHAGSRQRMQLDEDRYHVPPVTLKSWTKDWLWRRMFSGEFAHRLECRRASLEPYTDLIDRLALVYKSLGDEHSRRTLVAVLAHRILGPEEAPMPLNTPAYWSQREQTLALRAGREEIPFPFRNWRLQRYALAPIQYPIELYGMAPMIHDVFALEQYRYRRSTRIAAEPGDIVIDAGAGWGDTALYFGLRVGIHGRVYAFEFLPENLGVLRRNLTLNPELSERISLVEQPLWSASGREMHYRRHGLGTAVTAVSAPDADGCVQSVSIDDFVRESGLRRVDFIKMDIEGSEVEALRGARAVLEAYRPKLAIAVYHRPRHLVDIPELISTLPVGYRCYLDHFTTHTDETVLFATAGPVQQASEDALV